MSESSLISLQPRLHRYALHRRARAVVLALVITTGAVVAPAPAASAQTDDTESDPVQVVRYGGADRYETSLLVAQAVATDAGRKLDHVVMVSGRHWHDAVVAAAVAGRVQGPVLMTPPDRLRDDALAFLQRVGATNVTVVATGEGPDATVSPETSAALEEAGLSVTRLGGADRYETAVSVAEWMVGQNVQDASSRTAIVASGEVFADALVAGPLSARRGIPVLLSGSDELHPAVAEFLDDAGIERVVLLGGTAALSAEVESAVAALEITVDRLAGATRFETAILTGDFAAEFVGGGCFAGPSVGLARARLPFDSFSAAPLMARLCAPLVLTDPEKIPTSTADYLDGLRGSADDEVTLTVFGGDAAVSQSALDEYLATAPGSGPDSSETDEPSIDCGGTSADPPSQLISGTTYAREPAWSPDCSRIAYVHLGSLTIADADGRNATAVWRTPGAALNEPAWSPDGTQIALSVFSWEGGTGYANQRRHIYIVNTDGTDANKITEGTVEDQSPTWSPDGTRIAFQRTTWTDRSVSPPVGTDFFIVVTDPDGQNQIELNEGGPAETRPAWSPDAMQLAIVANGQVAVVNADGTGLRALGAIPHWLSSLSWSPDGSQIALARIAGPRDDPINVETNIAVLDVATGNVTPITSMEGTELNPHWSPDGKRILFNTYANSGRDTQIWVVGAQHRPSS